MRYNRTVSFTRRGENLVNPWVKKNWMGINVVCLIFFVLLIALGKYMPALNIIGFIGLVLQLFTALAFRKKIYSK